MAKLSRREMGTAKSPSGEQFLPKPDFESGGVFKLLANY
jgi:hypothetical protein